MTLHPGKLWLLFAAMTLLAGCGGGGSGGPPHAPTISSFTAARSTITAGTGTTLSAVFSGGTGVVSNGVGAISSGVPLSTGNLGTSTTFLLTVTNTAGATATSTVTVNVVPAPLISDFSATENPVTSGQSTSLSYSFTGGTGSIDQNIGNVTSGVGVGTGALSTTTTYRLTVTNAALDSVTADLTVTVTVTRFRTTGSMVVPRSGHTATALQDGRVLVAGGDALGTAEVYDPATGKFATTGTMGVARQGGGHAAARLADGRVLVTGGGGNKREATAELYDPATGSFTPTGPMLHGRTDHTATTLPNGKVLIVGGCCFVTGPSYEYDHDEIYDPVTGTFAEASPRVPSQSLLDHAAIALATGDVLIVGGWRGTRSNLVNASSDATVYDVASGLFAQVGSMSQPRKFPHAARLNDGRVLVVGAPHDGNYPVPREAALYDPVSATFAVTPPHKMAYPHSATTLPDGTVLVTGKVENIVYPSETKDGSAERYDPGTGTFKAEGQMRIPRTGGYTATRLLTGEVLFVGGDLSYDTATSSAELFR